MVVGINFPAGGFRVSADMEVLDVFGDPIAGLFAVAAARARCEAAVALLDANLTMREAGQVLGVSHQRIKQLADQAKDSAIA